jgi:hypothetical protein
MGGHNQMYMKCGMDDNGVWRLLKSIGADRQANAAAAASAWKLTQPWPHPWCLRTCLLAYPQHQTRLKVRLTSSQCQQHAPAVPSRHLLRR